MRSEILEVDTSRNRIIDLTDLVSQFCRAENDGLCSIFVPHATAGIAILELGAGSDEDLLTALQTLLPRDDRWRHRHGSTGHGADHVLPALVSPSLVVPVIDGAPALGTWQSIALVDTNEDNPRRQVRLSFMN